jgi:outer membrane assembly lipoprotein YfiO
MDTILKLLLDGSIRTIAIAIAVSCVLRAMRVKSPAVAHHAWTGVLLMMLFLPVLSLWAPRIAIPILPSTSISREIRKHPLPLSGSSLREKSGARESVATMVSDASVSPMPDSVRTQPYSESGIFPIASVFVVYFIGFCFFAARLLTGTALSHRLRRSAQWNERGFYESSCTVPLTIGLFRSRILLPVDSRYWNPEKLEAVLTHESEHARRHDPLVAWLALLNRCIYWFHPVAWWLCGKLTALAEQACDARVLVSGHDSSAYVEYLLEFARFVREKRRLVPSGGSRFHGSKLALRIHRIMVSAQTPSMSCGRLTAVAALCAFAALVPAITELARAHAEPFRLIPAFAPALPGLRGKPPQSDQVRAQAATTYGSNLSNVSQGTVFPVGEAGQLRPTKSDFSNSPDEGLYKTGLRLLDMHRYKEARQVFEKIIATFPDSGFEAASCLSIADSFYNEGGTENLGQALYNYARFLIRFPENPKAEEAEVKLIALQAKMANAPGNNIGQFYASKALLDFQIFVGESTDRGSYNRSNAKEAIYAYHPYEAEKVINRFLQKHPASDLVPIAKQALLDIQENLADGNYRVAQFYADRGDYSGALLRLKTIIDTYPNFSRMDEIKQLYESLSAAGVMEQSR